MNPETDFETHRPVRNAADAYAQALAFAGGKELKALARQGDKSAVRAAIYASPAYDLKVPALPVTRLSLNLTRSRISGGVEGERGRSYEALRYSMFLVPAGVPMAWRKDSPSRHLSIYFHPDALDCPGDGGAVLDQEQPVFNAQIAGIRHLADQLAAELDSVEALTAEATDSLARLLLVRLERKLRDLRTTSNPLTPKILMRLRDYVAEHLAERVFVADLAREAGLSPHRFAHAFSEHTREPPHQFVLRVRLDRAAQLLRASNLNLVDVAHDCGFATQQHLCNAMRRHLGTTPSLYRRTHKQRTEIED
ncbi:MAG: helix-turn-helix transcriptional regulator [Burkholderiaceae bacterium]|nr:helix-turn-helix transcriptional regulator [Burkholderiaceae bacterium]